MRIKSLWNNYINYLKHCVRTIFQYKAYVSLTNNTIISIIDRMIPSKINKGEMNQS